VSRFRRPPAVTRSACTDASGMSACDRVVRTNRPSPLIGRADHLALQRSALPARSSSRPRIRTLRYFWDWGRNFDDDAILCHECVRYPRRRFWPLRDLFAQCRIKLLRSCVVIVRCCDRWDAGICSGASGVPALAPLRRCMAHAHAVNRVGGRETPFIEGTVAPYVAQGMPPGTPRNSGRRQRARSACSRTRGVQRG
jgi:hypothetical protein